MNEISTCPQCRRDVQIPESLMGKNVKCPLCGTTFVASGAGAFSQAPQPPAAPWSNEPPPPPRPPPFRYPDRGEYPDDRRDYRDPYGYRGPYDRPVEPHRGAAVLTLGILSLVICGVGFVTGLIAWIMGGIDLSKIQRGVMDRQGEGTTRAGMICGIIGTVLQVLGFFLFILLSVLEEHNRRFR